MISNIDSDGYPIIPANFARGYHDTTHASDFRRKSNVAGIYQREQEQLSMMLVRKAKELTNSENICVAGGSFLNCNTNELIIRSELFKNQFFIPPADDSGIPLGCAWYAYCQVTTRGKNDMITPYFGKTYTNNDYELGLKLADENLFNGEVTKNCTVTIFDNESELLDNVSDLLRDGKVIGWMQGGSEIGPRALGNRSIIANPQFEWMEDYINGEVKLREWYRPFAPSVLYDRQGEVFDLDTYSPNMLVTTTVKEEWQSRIPAVTHIDKTSRYQSVTNENNPKYYNLISQFYQKTGIPLVLNTSFNGPDEPIVESPFDAVRTFWTRGLSALCMGNILIVRNNKIFG